MLSAERRDSLGSEGRAGRCTVISVLFGRFWVERGVLGGLGSEGSGAEVLAGPAAVEAAAEA